MLLSVIIVNYNVKYFLEQCLQSLQTALQSIEAEVWVVDNASTDGSVEYLQTAYNTVKFILNIENIGFSRANNQALLECKGEYVLFLNPDTLLAEDCLQNCLAFMQSNQNAGALGIRMIDGSGQFLPESKRSFPSPQASFYKLTGISGLFPSSRIFSRYALTYLDQHKNHEVDVLAGAFLIGRRKLLQQLNGFDEAFFMYGEDIDLSYRIQQLGYKNYYFSESTIIHFKGESTKKGSLDYVKMFYQAMRIFVEKHYTGTSARCFSLFMHAGIHLIAGASASKRLIQNVGKNFASTRSSLLQQPAFLVVGSKNEFEEVERLLRDNGHAVATIKWYHSHSLQGQLSGEIARITNEAKSVAATDIIFCSGIGYKLIVEIIQKLPVEFFLSFHGYGTGSIVGSNSKNTSGKFIAASFTNSTRF